MVFDAVIGKLFWPLAQLPGDYVGFGAITATLFLSLAQLLGDFIVLSRSYCQITYVPHETSTGNNSLSLQGLGLDTSSVHVGFVVD